MIFLHVHKRGVMIRFAVAVPLSADMQSIRVLLQLCDPLIYCFAQSLQRCFSLAFTGYKYGFLGFCSLMNPFAQLLQMPDSDFLRNVKADFCFFQL